MNSQNSKWIAIAILCFIAGCIFCVVVRPSQWMEKFAHYPPFRQDNFRSWPDKRAVPKVNSDKDPSQGWWKPPSSGVGPFGFGYSTLYKNTPSRSVLEKPDEYEKFTFPETDKDSPPKVKNQDHSKEIYWKFRDPMSKSCRDRDPLDPPRWPLSYDYPYRDPLFEITTTKFYTASNDDPENLSEQILWPHVY